MKTRQFSLLAVAVAVPLAMSALAGVAAAAPPGAIEPLLLTTREVSELTAFSSPSGNIGCYIDPDSVRCDIRERDWAPPPKPASCPEMTGWGQGLQLDAGKSADYVCAGDTALTTGNPLAYGDKIVSGSIECTSTPDGITCWDFVYGGEFSISRQAIHLA
ncbi:hypothetical protein [Mycolicibacterium stellerae]|uniref:hypothetical protein n=1 Tax=Mycolicibacterium stellerae TaxID=2358193 RepID=UPI0019D28388|nr:hypothetical protein [Mycolicibacterium stellerae]